MGFRVLFYMTQIWDSQRRAWESENIAKSEWRLRPILPIVFYTGEQRWQTPLTLDAMMDLPEALARFVPSFETLFLSVKETDPADLTQTDHPFGWLLTVLQKERATPAEISRALSEAVSHINTLAVEEAEQWQRSIFYLYLLILHRRPPSEHEALTTLVQQQIQDASRREEVETMAQTMAEYLVEQGIEQGETRAKQQDILKLLAIRFEAVPESVAHRVTSIQQLDQLDTLFERAATVETLDEIDWQHFNGN